MKFNNSGEIMKIMTLKCINHKGSHAQVACQSKVRERKGEFFFSSPPPPLTPPHPPLPHGSIAPSLATRNGDDANP